MTQLAIHARILRDVVFKTWQWTQMSRALKELEGQPVAMPTMPPLNLVLALQLRNIVNDALPEGLEYKLSFSRAEGAEPHVHADRQGQRISCARAAALEALPGYALVDTWESDDGNTMVSTVWRGRVPRMFDTRVFSTVEALHGKSVGSVTEAQARQHHQDAVAACRQFLAEN